MSLTPSKSLQIPKISTLDAQFSETLQKRLHVDDEVDDAIQLAVKQIIADVRVRKDQAVLEYTQRFDRMAVTSIQDIKVHRDDLKKAFEQLPQDQQQALTQAADRVRHYHEQQKAAIGQSWQFKDEFGSTLGQRFQSLDSVGIYVPGGKASYPSSVLMNAIPAHVAGVQTIVMVVPTPDGVRNPLVMAAAYVANVDTVFCIGGAQAVAALAYGTDFIPKVDKIVGPGNAYVAEAKRQVFGQVGIDMIAGPSEILIIADGSTPAQWVAMDLFSQAEHDEMAQSILLSPNQAYIDEVEQAIQELLPTMPRQEIIRTSLANRGLMITTQDLDEACQIANTIAAEHLEISIKDSVLANQCADQITSAGAIFIGAFTSESLGDYCAGPNHVLPTSGTARFSSALGVYDFQKRSSIVEVSAKGAHHLGKIASVLAYGEGLTAHAKSAEYRLGSE